MSSSSRLAPPPRACNTMTGNLFIVCAPSGAGKTSWCGPCWRANLVSLSVSHTTRAHAPRRTGRARLSFRLAAGVRGDDRTRRVPGKRGGARQPLRHFADLDRSAARPRAVDIVLEIDWQGAQQVRRLIPGRHRRVHPAALAGGAAATADRPAPGQRGGDREAPAAPPRGEIAHVEEFDYVIINSDFEEAVEDLASIVRSARLTVIRQIARHQRLDQQPEVNDIWRASP